MRAHAHALYEPSLAIWSAPTVSPEGGWLDATDHGDHACDPRRAEARSAGVGAGLGLGLKDQLGHAAAQKYIISQQRCDRVGHTRLIGTACVPRERHHPNE